MTMMTYMIYKQAILPADVTAIATLCDAAFDDQVTAGTTMALSDRQSCNRYPGIELPFDANLLNIATEFATKYTIHTKQSVLFDAGPGTAATYVNAVAGESISTHVDRPIYVLDSSYNVLPEFDNRYCDKTVIVCVSSDYVGGDIDVFLSERVVETVHLAAGDVVVIDGLTPHALLPVTSGQFKAVCYFMCGTS